MPSRILVTGANGFIGKKLVMALRARGDLVGVMDIGHDEVGDWDGIIHLAAVSRRSVGDRDPLDCLRANVMLTAEIIQNRSFDWLILAGTQELPSSVYGLSKRFAEDYCSIMAPIRGFRWKSVRFPVVYGPGDNDEKLIPRIRGGGELREGVLPITAMHVYDVIDEIIAQIGFLQSQMIVDTEAKLRRVAASY